MLIFFHSIIDNNNTVPVILTDESDSIISVRNFNMEKTNDTEYLRSILKKLKENNEPIIVDLE